MHPLTISATTDIPMTTKSLFMTPICTLFSISTFFFPTVDNPTDTRFWLFSLLTWSALPNWLTSSQEFNFHLFITVCQICMFSPNVLWALEPYAQLSLGACLPGCPGSMSNANYLNINIPFPQRSGSPLTVTIVVSSPSIHKVAQDRNLCFQIFHLPQFYSQHVLSSTRKQCTTFVLLFITSPARTVIQTQSLVFPMPPVLLVFPTTRPHPTPK